MKNKQLVEGVIVWIAVLGCIAIGLIKPFKSGNGWFYFIASLIAIFYGVRYPKLKK